MKYVRATKLYREARADRQPENVVSPAYIDSEGMKQSCSWQRQSDEYQRSVMAKICGTGTF